ncbi:hypothetical protein KSS87_017965 [Heliosperma pusillum]|nr:hypothetical protein KSS87_001412 [Heliosperma pusillum]KAH9614919.1 hypothetical protein KSS87_002902 [Heliosperma pusillum]KAH9617435.1 hypothetical protein KSS87_013834 [Heliosperma pusillum]KAH9620478.1 hypothetical protein KSS87_017965 [Heliosperma pusillum]
MAGQFLLSNCTPFEFDLELDDSMPSILE